MTELINDLAKSLSEAMSLQFVAVVAFFWIVLWLFGFHPDDSLRLLFGFGGAQ